MKEIPLSAPNLNMNILENLRECVETGWVSTGGRFITEFEKKAAAYFGVDEAVSMQSGTAGLHLALKVSGIKDGDEVFTPALTFIAAANPVKYLGAEPVFVDCDESFCVDPAKLEKFCDNECEFTESGLINKLTKKRIKAIIIVHVFGNMADMERIVNIAQKYKLTVIEDASEAVGTYYTQGAFAGRFAGTIGEIGIYSFNANKIITTGGGGMVVSREKEYLDKMRYLSTTAKDDSLYFVHGDIGYNYRMLNIQAAFGVSQIDELEEFVNIKKKNYERYANLLDGIKGITLMPFREGIRPNYWFYSIYVNKSDYGLSRDELMNKLITNKIQCRPVWKPVNDQKPYVSAMSIDVVKARECAANILNLPCSVDLEAEQVKYVCDIIRDN